MQAALQPNAQEFARLQKENEILREENAGLLENIAGLLEKVAVLTHQLEEMKRLVFGVKSERFVPEGDAAQGALFELSEPVPVPSVTVTRTLSVAKRVPVRQVLPAHLPREVITIEPEGDLSRLKKIGVEVTETLDYVPGTLKVIRRERPKYVDPLQESGGVIIAALPCRLIDKGIAEPGLLAHVLISKYVDHLPAYRQMARFRRAGVSLPSSTVGGWIAQSAWHLVPLYEALRQEALESGYLQVDETTIAVQDSNKKGKTHRGSYWVYHAPQAKVVVMEYCQGRQRAGPAAFLQGYTGALQHDGSSAYDGFEAVPAITTHGCWAHARRYFHKALESHPKRARHVLEQIKALYAIERRVRGEASSVRLCVRQKEALPLVEALKMWLEAHLGLPKSPWGRAVRYTLSRYKKLIRYTSDGRIEIDNNGVENTIRPIALGRKNYLFAGSHAAARRAAVIYSLLGTCKKHDVNPEAYLKDVLSRIGTHPSKRVSELLPHHWNALREASPALAA